ncbi:MAG: PQQ-like beta-propeller repeat protein [Rhodobacteraceae bacterium]|nr:PQQ-like beta-propeller repeat protein [Paracoccaceae bacterium]
MIAAYFPSRTGLMILASAMLTLAACSEPEFILPGEREEVRSAVEGGSVVSNDFVNQSRAISLPAQTNNKDWEQAIGSPVNRVSNAALRSNPQLIWSTPIGVGDGRRQRITADPVVGGGLVYTLDAAALVSGIASNGAVVWTTDLRPVLDGDKDATGGGMAYAGGTLYVSLGYGRLAAIDAKTGGIRWQQKLDATGSGAPTVSGDLIYLVAGDNTGWAIKTDTGRIEWKVLGTPSLSNVLGAPAPALTSKFAVFAFGSGDIVTTFRRGGLRRWEATVTARQSGRAASRISDVTGSPVISGNTLYAGNHSGRILAAAVDTGERLWTADRGAIDPVWPVGGSVFAITERSEVVRLNANDGELIWAQKLPGFVKDKPRRRASIFAHYGPILAGSRIITASNDGYLRFFAPEDGSIAAQIPVPDGATTAPVVAGGTLYVVSTKGELHAFR